MNNYSQQEQDPDSFGLDILAQLSIYVDSENKVISFACDWTNDETGIDNISKIIYGLKTGDLVEKILKGLYKQCVFNNNVDEYNKILNAMDALSQKSKKPNEVLIKPRDISKLQ